jgi:WD40 repeat protein
MSDEEAYIFEEATISESDDDFEYQSVQLDQPSVELSEEEDDYDTLVNTAQRRPKSEVTSVEPLESKHVARLVTTDDFVRNFLVRLGLSKTLESFQSEWYELQAKGRLKQEDIAPVPDVYIRNSELREQVTTMRKELEKAQFVAENTKGKWDKLRKERDFHKMHHQRVQQEKAKLVSDVDKLRKMHEQYDDRYKELASKYEAAMKEKMLIKLERDRLKSKAESLQKSIQEEVSVEKPAQVTISKTLSKTGKKTKPKTTSIPPPRPNPHLNATAEPSRAEGMTLFKTFKGHQMAVAGLAIHPRKPILATVSDDHSWKLWTLMNGELIMSAQGHDDWVSGVAFHPRGGQMVTASGDCSVKVWNVVEPACLATLTGHTQAVWSVNFNDTGDYFVSASMDHSLKLWDMQTLACKSTFRGHVDSVNSCQFQPYTNCFVSASGDKTVSLWDIASGQCVQTFYGHLNSVNSAVFNLKADLIASADSDGVVKLWDVRMVREQALLDTGRYPANSVAFDRSGQVLFVASEDASIYCYKLDTGEQVNSLKGHEEGVQDVVYDINSRCLISAGADCTFRVWQ